MRRAKRVLLSIPRKFERGSALLVTLMVLVGMSLLGLGFVALSETESAISVNERNHAQTVALAEAGAREVVQWFQNPTAFGPSGLNLMPGNSTIVKTQRATGSYTGYYRPISSDLLFDLPFGPASDDLFLGTELSADVKVTRALPANAAYLDNLNNTLLGPAPAGEARSAGEITEIDVYAPPIIGGNLVGTAPNQFWSGGTRYGVATIAVRVDKFNKAGAGRVSIANTTCRIVVSQFPLPVPAGPLQSQTALATNGNFNVHWGLVSSQTTLDLKKDYVTLPWVNAYERLHYERGWDSSVEWAATTAYRLGDIIRPTAATLAANAPLRFHEYTVTTAGTTAATEPPSAGVGAWPTSAAATVTSGTVVMRERAPSAYPLTTGGGRDDSNTPWLNFLNSGLTIEDPWFQARSAGTILGDAAGPQPYPFPYNAPGTYTKTHHFQNQSFDQYSAYRRLIFPDVNYDVWKAAAQAANGQGEVHYLYPENGTGPNFTDGITTQSFIAWTNRGGGFYFFDTLNQQNPQNGGPGDISLQISPSGGGTQPIRGFVYVNASLGTKGLGGVTGNFNQPGEPYEDIGYRRVAQQAGVNTNVGAFETDAAGQPVIEGAYNKQWDFEDLPWSNSGSSTGAGTPNQYFDVCIVQRTVTNPNGGGAYAGWFVAPYYPGCLPGNNQQLGTCNCSEPHEPYVNVIYDGNSTLGLPIGFQNPASQTRVAKQLVPPDGPRTSPRVSCSASYATSSTTQCTSNGYDREGALVNLTVAVDGVLYIENEFDSTGNAEYYGSVLVGQGGVNAKGTPTIWYDEALQRGDWRPPGIPRVLVTSVETDQ
jgi:hypothetical protein